MLYCSAEVGEGEREKERELGREGGEWGGGAAGQCCVWLRLALVVCSRIHIGAVEVAMSMLN